MSTLPVLRARGVLYAVNRFHIDGGDRLTDDSLSDRRRQRRVRNKISGYNTTTGLG